MKRRCTASLSPPSFVSPPVAKSIGPQRTRGRDGVGPGSECIRVSQARGGLRESLPLAPPSPSPSSSCAGTFSVPYVPTFSAFLFSCSSSSSREREKERERARRVERERKRKRGEGEPRRLMEYIMMRPAVLRRLNGRVCVLRKR